MDFETKARARYALLLIAVGMLGSHCLAQSGDTIFRDGFEFSVDAGGNRSVTLPDTRVALPGLANGQTFQWTQVSGPATVVFKSASTPSTWVMADTPGTYQLRLTATTGSGAAISSDMQLTVNPNPVVINANSTPLDHLRTVLRPAFRQGNTLLPLSQSSCGVAPAINVELIKYWGYTAQFNASVDLAGPVATEVRAHPGRYPVEISYGNVYRIFDNYDGSDPGLPQLPPSVWLREANGNIYLENGRPVVSPAAPDAAMTAVGQFLGEIAGSVEASLGEKITIINNAGEYGVWLFGDRDPQVLYGRDPAVVADYANSGFDNWFDYNASSKARQERLIKEGIFSRLTRGRPLYEWYQESYGTERGRWAGWDWYNFRWERFLDAQGRPTVSDYSSPEMYYAFHNGGWSGINYGSMVPWDALTQALKNAGGTVKLGQRNIYPWVSLGWDGGDSGGISDVDLFIGAMKAYYTAGAIGAVSGYFTCDGPIFQALRLNGPIGTSMPTQIKGLYALGEVHALFSYLEDYLRNGELLKSANLHPYESFEVGGPTYAMEFRAVGETAIEQGQFGPVTIPTARVIARKIVGEERWLITAWANTGSDRDIRVTVDPVLGELTLRARRAGSVYEVRRVGGQVVKVLLDPDAMNPTHYLFP